MGEKSKIEWCDASWSPLRVRVRDDAVDIARTKGYTSLIQIGEKMAGRVGHHCEHVSPECEHCYSESLQSRCLKANGTGLPFDRRSRDLIEPIVDEKILMQPLDWRKPKRIFVESQSDLFGEWFTDEQIDRAFAVMALCPQHRFMVLTKRPERLLRYMTEEIPLTSRGSVVMGQAEYTGKIVWDSRGSDRQNYYGCGLVVSNRRPWCGWTLPNVELGVTAGTRKGYKERVSILRKIPAAVRFVSAEPLLEDLGQIDLTGIHQVIVGGESGRGARPMRIDWARSLRDQCVEAGVAFFFKQMSSNGNKAYKDFESFPVDLRVREFPEVQRG